MNKNYARCTLYLRSCANFNVNDKGIYCLSLVYAVRRDRNGERISSFARANLEINESNSTAMERHPCSYHYESNPGRL